MRTRMSTIGWAATAAGALALGLSACGAEDPAEIDMAAADTETAAMEEAAPADAMPGRTAAPEGAAIRFANLADGDTVASPFRVAFAVEGMDVAPAGDQTPGTGHFHILVDTTADALDMEFPIPADDQHIHFGAAQMETTLDLPSGEHTLQLVMGDWTHIPHDPVVASDVITVTAR